MSKRKKQTESHPRCNTPGALAHSARGTLRSYTVGALPILNHFLKRLKLEDALHDVLPREDPRSKLSASKTLLVLMRNLLVSREPLYGLGEWAARHAPNLLGLTPDQIAMLSDDRTGRSLDRLFLIDFASFSLLVAAGAVLEFNIDLDQLHNDSTTITFCGDYANAAIEKHYLGQPTLAITFGFNKDHRPDLKQLLYLLTVSRDGGVPLHFRVENGNKTDDQTHCRTWDVLSKLVGRPDFLYVADSKLATRENMSYIASHSGRFVTVLPRSRSEDNAFRQRLQEGQVTWQLLWEKTDEYGEVVDHFSICDQPTVSAEGYRLAWYHSTRKAELDAATRAKQIDRILSRLGQLRQKLTSSRTRYRQPDKVQRVVDEILAHHEASRWIHVTIVPHEEETYRHEKPGRPGKDARYVRQVRTRLKIDYVIDAEQLAAERAGDGVFPLVSNVWELSPLELLHAYKGQSKVEKRFSQLKTDFEVAPVYLKEVRRIEALLCVYFLAMLVEALLERELRRAMEREGIESLPMYPEGRACRCPTARRVIDLFADVQRHEWETSGGRKTVMVTELTALQRRILELLGLNPETYGL